MLKLLAVPQRGMPYVQMGFRIVLYIFGTPTTGLVALGVSGRLRLQNF